MNQSENSENRFTFGVEGMTCASCVRIVERSLKKMEGVHFVSINLGTEKGYVITDSNITFDDIKKQIDSTGYRALHDVPDNEKVEKDFKTARKRMLLSLAIFIPVTILMIFHMWGFHMPWFVPLELMAGAITIFGPGRGIFKGAYIAASHAHANMDTLVATGAVASWATSLLHMSGMEISSFGSLSVMLVALHLTGRYIESRLKFRASGEVRALLAMRPRNAFIIMEGEAVEVPAENVPVGALTAVRSGERIPLDGIITEGVGFIDESMITGEPERVHRLSGEEVTGGTVLESGNLKIEVTRTGEDTFLARMIRLVEDAQSSSVPIQGFADKITGIFVPVVFILASISGGAWFLFYDSLLPYLESISSYLPWINPGAGALSTAIFIFIAVLVIACPCAMGLATPMALIAGSGLAAKNGLIIKNGEAMQRAGEIEVIFLDKTGTITSGTPEVISSDLDEKQLAMGLALENVSIHPLADAVKKHCEFLGVRADASITDITEQAGEGISGTAGDNKIFIGRPLNPEKYSEKMSRGETVVEFRSEGEPAGYISIADPVKTDSPEAVKDIISLGINPVMLTGDSRKTAEAVAESTGINDILSGLRPEQKLYEIQEYQKKGVRAGMVGDGINDAAALRAADIGIALGTGTDLSIESADIIITSGRLTAVPDAIRISRSTYKKIRQNLFRAFIYNIIAIPAAVAGLLHPAIAEVCMILSSVNVIINSMSIKK
ncbi:MAG TPA: heavy metal translocating P-type ATPase [Spirochaetota bacterium]|nr:heavy metal translocating P-type ATPase [Spirochaetota bacterium]HPJ33679.1 heavy metal translocating P-type ATPase [Spirochaetota bacterium]